MYLMKIRNAMSELKKQRERRKVLVNDYTASQHADDLSSLQEMFLYPVVSAEEWSNRYGIPIITIPCEYCGDKLRIDIPYAYGDERGLTVIECGSCGTRRTESVFRSKSNKKVLRTMEEE
jgi:hypothetical protein